MNVRRLAPKARSKTAHQRNGVKRPAGRTPACAPRCFPGARRQRVVERGVKRRPHHEGQWSLEGGLQVDRWETTGDVEAGLAFDADRLKRKRAAKAADQCVSANLGTHGRTGGYSAVA